MFGCDSLKDESVATLNRNWELKCVIFISHSAWKATWQGDANVEVEISIEYLNEWEFINVSLTLGEERKNFKELAVAGSVGAVLSVLKPLGPPAGCCPGL